MNYKKPVFNSIYGGRSITKTYKAYNIRNIYDIKHLKEKFSVEKIEEIITVAKILPFKTNNYIVEELIDWEKVPDDPIFILNFPNRDMLQPVHYSEITKLSNNSQHREKLNEIIDRIRLELNPHPSGQKDYNVPFYKNMRLQGAQHKYHETILFFPKQAQTCHAYCTFCFRWPQFTGMNHLKFAMKEIEPIIEYIKEHEEITDILFTGGDPMVLKAGIFEMYINKILDANIEHLRSIRIGTKVLSYWPYKFITDDDADSLLRIFERIVNSAKNLAFMAHFNHPVELSTDAVKLAIKRLQSTGAQIRTQSPIVKHINDNAEIWSEMWREQVRLGMIPYYMFIPRDTGAFHYFNVKLKDAYNIFRKAIKKTSGLCRTVRGPVMSSSPGKIQVLGYTNIKEEKVFILTFIQSRNPKWSYKPFFAQFDENASWISDLKPAFGQSKFFFEDELNQFYTLKRMMAESIDFN